MSGEVVGSVAVVPLHGWSSHVGEVRLVVDPDHRGRGIGRRLARQAVLDAVDMGLTKLVVEVISDQAALIAMFRGLGFEPEALLTDHVRDRAGQMRDLIVLANSVDEQFVALSAAGRDRPAAMSSAHGRKSRSLDPNSGRFDAALLPEAIHGPATATEEDGDGFHG